MRKLLRSSGLLRPGPGTMYPLNYSLVGSSVARGGVGLRSMQNRTFLVLLRPIFGEKLKTAPPPKEIGCRSCEVHVVIQPEKTFEFSISGKNQSEFWCRPFFFFFVFVWRPPVFDLKKRLNFRFGPKNQS